MKAGYLVLCLALAGCADQEVLDIGSGRYSLTGSAQTHCPSGAREDALIRANDFCAIHHGKPMIESFDDKIGLNCASSIIFRCQ